VCVCGVVCVCVVCVCVCVSARLVSNIVKILRLKISVLRKASILQIRYEMYPGSSS